VNFSIPVTLDLNDDNLMDLGSFESDLGSEEVVASHGNESAPPVRFRCVCMECGAFMGQSGAENLHVASCSGKLPVVEVRVYENGMIDYPAMTDIPAQFLVPSE
jgi:hypothetical protein